MKRDWQIIRELLEKFEDESIGSYLENLPPRKIESINKERNERIVEEKLQLEDLVFGHLLLLFDSHLITGIKVEYLSGQWVFSGDLVRMTSSGHDLLDSLRNKTIWSTVKETARKLSIPISVELIKAVAAKLANNA